MDKKLITAGRIMQFCSLHRIAYLTQRSPNVRVTYTHEVRNSDMENFDRIVHYLRQTRTIVSPDFFLSLYARHMSLNLPFLLMTFDDGLLSSYRAAQEVLDPYGIKAIFFIPTAILELKSQEEMKHFAAEKIYYDRSKLDHLVPEEYQFMTADHLLELSAKGHYICPHTHSHVFIRDIRDAEAAQRELIRPKEILENLLRKKINVFAFPVGSERQVGQYSYKCIQDHYEFCFTALNGANTLKTAPYFLYRDCLPSEAPLSYVQMVMKGTYDLYYLLKMYRLKKIVAS